MQPWLNPKFDRMRRRNFFIPGCFCCGGGGEVLEGCDFCGTSIGDYSASWEFTISGVTNTGGSDCSDINGTFTLVADSAEPTVGDASACTLSNRVAGSQDTDIDTATPTSCASVTWWWALWYQSFNSTMRLDARQSNGATFGPAYTTACANWNRTSANTMNLVGGQSTTCCDDFPSSITIEPV